MSFAEKMMNARIEAMESVDREVQARLNAPEVPVIKVLRENRPLLGDNDVAA